MTRTLAGVVALVVGLLMTPVASAAQAVAPPSGAAADLRPAEIQRLFDAYLVMEAQQTLGLTDAQYGPFLTRLKALQEARRRFQASRALILVDLARLSGPRAPRADEAALKERLAALQELESRGAAESRKAYAEVDALLDPRQQARFRVFEDQIERRKIELMLRARQNARQQRLQPRR
jgi:hypothetical protein